MKKKSLHNALLVLTILLFTVISGIQAQGEAVLPSDGPVVYEAILANDGETEVQLLYLEAEVSPGSAYVGLAAGSQVSQEARRLENHLTWEGPFVLPPGGRLTLRYWLVPTSSEPQPSGIEVLGHTQTGVVVRAAARPTKLEPSPMPIVEGATSPQAVTVAKVAETPELPPGSEPWVAYLVTFTNSDSAPAALDSISDSLASGFEFIGMAVGSDVQNQPVDPEASTVVWEGPFAVAGKGTLRLRYWVRSVEVMGTYVNSVQAIGDGVPIGPATATVTVQRPVLSLDKVASPLTLATGQTVRYDVTILNAGNYPGTVDVISDTLPAGFTFRAMDPASDVRSDPKVYSDTLVWEGPIVASVGAGTHLIYQVRSSGIGSKTNSVVAQTSDGEQLGPADSTVTTEPAVVSLPLAVLSFGAPSGLPMEEEFTTGVPPEWTPLLVPQGWRWRGDGVTWGRYDFDAGQALEQWALSMYLGERAQSWTDYRIEATLRAGWHYSGPLVGLWFRGTVDEQSGDLGGYLFCLRPREDMVHLGYVDPDAQGLSIKWAGAAPYKSDLGTWYKVKIEVRGANIQVWVNNTQVFNWTDPKATWERGTVGFTVYRGEGGFDDIRVSALD